jgi:hypothetical protein
MMGIARGIQKGEVAPKPGTPSAQVAATMKPAALAEFASTPHEGLPKKKRERKPPKSPMLGGKMKVKRV